LGAGETGSFGQNRRGGPRHDLDDILGDTVSTCTMDDIEQAGLILVAGADPSATHPVLGMAIRRALKRGAEMIVVNSSQLDLQRPDDLWLDARRGTAGIIYAAVLAQIFENDLSGGNGSQKAEVQALRASVASLTPAGAAIVSGVDAVKIQAFAEKFAGARKVVAVYDLDETLERATDDLKALAQLLIVTGRHGRPGEGLMLLRSDCNSLGAKLAGIDNPLHLDRIRTALVLFENPFGDYRTARELGKIEHLVVMDHFLTETARMADVVLPAATLAESEGTIVSFDGKMTGVRQASRPVAGLTNAEILAKVAVALGRPAVSVDPAAMRAVLAASMGIDPSDLEKRITRCSVWPRKAAHAPSLVSIRIDSTASTANFFPYASLDGILEKKLADLRQ
jgi:predicted molibdopterin-dependent oxidoreductase YjgC